MFHSLSKTFAYSRPTLERKANRAVIPPCGRCPSLFTFPHGLSSRAQKKAKSKRKKEENWLAKPIFFSQAIISPLSVFASTDYTRLSLLATLNMADGKTRVVVMTANSNTGARSALVGRNGLLPRLRPPNVFRAVSFPSAFQSFLCVPLVMSARFCVSRRSSGKGRGQASYSRCRAPHGYHERI